MSLFLPLRIGNFNVTETARENSNFVTNVRQTVSPGAGKASIHRRRRRASSSGSLHEVIQAVKSVGNKNGKRKEKTRKVERNDVSPLESGQ